MKTAYVVCLSAALAACGARLSGPDLGPDASTSASTDASTNASTDARAAADVPRTSPTDASIAAPETREVTIGPLRVPRGEERTVCVTLDVGNTTPVMVRAIHAHLTNGSHHMIVTRVSTGQASPVPAPCGAFAHGGDVLFIAQQRESEIAYPAGTGLRFAAHQLVGVEMHYINYFSDAPADIAGAVEFDTYPIDPGAPLREVRFQFSGTLSLSLPAHQQTQVRSFERIPAGAQIFALTSHTHQLGVRATIQRATSMADTSQPLLHESRSWSDAPLTTLSPMVTLNSNEGLLLTCEYNNTTNQNVGFGTGFADEMCFLWAHYVLP